MNILVVGSGAREHALLVALAKSPSNAQLFCFGSNQNPGIAKLVSALEVGDITNCQAVLAKAVVWNINLAIIGPEAPLAAGLADALWAANIPTIGPTKALAEIETSKAFARQLMAEYAIVGSPRFKHFIDLTDVETFLHELGENNYVIKANGLMGGKGVKVAGDHLHSFQEALVFCQEIIAAKQSFVIEEKLIGQEFSLMCFADGEHLIPMPLVQDHKRAFVDDQGPNTGGMGSYSDSNHSLPFLTDSDVQSAFAITQDVYQALMKKCASRYIGILYGSFIATNKGIYVIEFNARFGDPESLNCLSILNSDFAALCQAMVNGALTQDKVEFAKVATVCKYAVPVGYPQKSVKDAVIDIDGVANKAYLYLGSVEAKSTGLVTAGSRTAAYVGVADTLEAAERLAEAGISAIRGPLFHREDIGTKACINKRIKHMEALRNDK